MLGHGALGEFALGEFDMTGSPVAVTGPAWRRIAAQRALSQMRKDEEEAILLLLS
jgi:hypothetical protein